MINSQEPHQSNHNQNFSIPARQINHEFIPSILTSLKNEPKSSNSSPSFFSENGLLQDLIKVTRAEPDVCLEVFYDLYYILWPQIDSQSYLSLKDAWMDFIGNSVKKGSLCPPEKLIIERKVKDLKRIMSEPGGEAQIFHEMDGVINSILNLKQKIDHYPGEIRDKKEVLELLTLVQEFYQGYRNQVKRFVQVILDKERVNAAYGLESDALEDLLEPKAIMMSDIFDQHWAYRISRSQAQKLLSLDMHGRILKSNRNDSSNHRVIALPERSDKPLVFFKANGDPPIQPQKEFMLKSLYQHLPIQIPVPETALLVLTDVFETNPDSFYALQASEAVIGESSLKAYRDPKTTFDHEAYVSQTIGAFLTNPSDGSFKNFQYSPIYQSFIGIDNDMIFKPEITEKRTVNVKSMLYLLSQIDLPIPESIKTLFESLDPHLTALLWLKDLSQKNTEYNLLLKRLRFQRTRCLYQNLLPQSELLRLATCLNEKVQVDPGLHGESFFPKILLSKDFLIHFIEKLQVIEKALQTNRSINTQILFEKISPVVGKYYRKLRFKFRDPEEALDALWGNQKNDAYIPSLLEHKEFSNLLNLKNEFDEDSPPETLFKEYKDILSSGQSVLDKFIRRQNQRKMNNSLNLQVALKELELLIQEGLTHSQSVIEIVSFCHSLSKNVGNNHNLIKKIISLLSNLPSVELKCLGKHFLQPDRLVPKSLRTSSVEVLGAFMKKRTFLLAESENQYLFDQQGNIKKNASLTGRSRVTCFPEKNPEFYLKQYPEWPGYEFASTLFMRLLGIQHLPGHDLLIFNSKYPVLLTEKARGSPVLRFWHLSQAFKNLDPFHTGLLIISAMLINPEDGKEDNFILSPDGKYLIPIDNDHCFLPSTFQKEGSFWNAFTSNTALQTKTILFCLDEMNKPIPLDVRQHIISIDFDLLLTKWMSELYKLENRFDNLVDQNQQNKFLEQGTVMRIPFYKLFIDTLHWKAHKIQGILKNMLEPTPFYLLKAVEPFVAKCYQDSFKRGHNLQTRFKAATKQLYTKTEIYGNRISIINSRDMMEIIKVSEKDLQSDILLQRMGPVDALELLNQLTQERSQKVAMEQEMLYELDDKKHEKKLISLFGNPPLEGALKAFRVNPEEGFILKGSKLISSSSKLTALLTPEKRLKIRFLSMPSSSSLSDKEIRMLVEECPHIEYLNVSESPKLKEIATIEGEWPFLVRLEARNCVNLKKFVSYSPIKVLRIGTGQEIDIFVEQSTLSIFTISTKTNGFEFSLKKGEDIEIKLQGHIISKTRFLLDVIRRKQGIVRFFRDFKVNLKINSNLIEKAIGASITSLDLKNSNIETEEIRRILQFELLSLNKLDLSQNKKMEIASLEILIQGDWRNLHHLDLSGNIIVNEGFKTLCRGDWPLLEILNLSSTTMIAAGVKTLGDQAKWPQLKSLSLSRNNICDEGLEALSRIDWPLLEILDLSFSGTTREGLQHFILNTKCFKLKKINIYSIKDRIERNAFPDNWPLPQEFDLSKSEITHHEIRVIVKRWSWPQLTHLNLSENKINDKGLQILSRGNWPLLEILNLSKTNITEIGVEALVYPIKWLELKSLDLSDNEIGDEAISILCQGNWPLLQNLNLKGTNITEVGVKALTIQKEWRELKQLNISENEINDDAVEALFQANWPLLEKLDLSYTRITKRKYLHFVLTTQWPNLEEVKLDSIGEFARRALLPKNSLLLQELNLRYGEITQNEIELMMNKCSWLELRHLYLSENNILDNGIEMLSRGNWPKLRTLDLRKTHMTSVGVKMIVNQAKWPWLKSLSLSENEIGDEGVKAFAQGSWPLLRILNLRGTKMTGVGVEALTTLGKWPQLADLNLSENEIYDKAVQVLSKGEWPQLSVLNLSSTNVTGAIQIFFSEAYWADLKIFDDENIIDEERKTLAETMCSNVFSSIKDAERY